MSSFFMKITSVIMAVLTFLFSWVPIGKKAKRFSLKNFTHKIVCDGKTTDAFIETEFTDDSMKLYITATADCPKFVELKWRFSGTDNTLVLGDAWERSYGKLCFKKLSENKRAMPWYFLAKNGDSCFCFGVKTQANSFVSFRYDEQGITALVDCRNGGGGVALNGRKLCLAQFIYKEYSNSDEFSCLCDFCGLLCDSPILPDCAVYGGNNWYYAYGKSSFDEIISDAELQTELAGEIANRPFEVVDDGWQLNPCAGPWIANDDFGDMKALADGIKAVGARPGIWVRFLRNLSPDITPDMLITRGGVAEYLDPTVAAVQELIKSDIERIKGWGYELLKHDFTTVDLFGNYGKDLTDTITNVENWHFHDTTKTNAEIVLDLYRLIKDACGEMLIIGCNTVSHLCAGLVQINRIGDDTSGKEWSRTKKMGVNTLAFRLAQNNTFYLADADCVGIIGDEIPWEKNRQWLDLLAHSGTALFISCNKTINDEKRNDIAAAYSCFNLSHTLRPLDWTESVTPSFWSVDSKAVEYNW